MEQDATTEWYSTISSGSFSSDSKIFDASTALFWQGVELYYRRRSYVEALSYFIEAAAQLEQARVALQDLQYNIRLFMYKAWVMSSHDKSRTVTLPISFLHLEGLLESSEDLNRRRAVWMAKHFGRLGLRLFERFGDQETWH